MFVDFSSPSFWPLCSLSHPIAFMSHLSLPPFSTSFSLKVFLIHNPHLFSIPFIWYKHYVRVCIWEKLFVFLTEFLITSIFIQISWCTSEQNCVIYDTYTLHIHQLVDKHLSGFCFLAVVNRGTVDMDVHVALVEDWILCVPRSGKLGHKQFWFSFFLFVF